MLIISPKERITCRAALEHPWMTKIGKTDANPAATESLPQEAAAVPSEQILPAPDGDSPPSRASARLAAKRAKHSTDDKKEPPRKRSKTVK